MLNFLFLAIEPVVEPEFPPPPSIPDAPQLPQVPPEPLENEAPEVPEAPEEFPSSDEEVDQDIYLPAKELFDEVNKWMTKGTFHKICCSFSKITHFQERILMEYIDKKNSLDSKLEVCSICSFRNRSRN